MVSDRESGGKSGEKPRSGELRSGRAEKGTEKDVSFVESLSMLLKLNALKKRAGVSESSAKEIDDLQEKIESGDESEKAEATSKIDTIFKNIIEVDQGLEEDISLEDSLEGISGVTKKEKDTASQINARILELKEKDKAGKVKEEEVLEVASHLRELSEDLGFHIEEDVNPGELFSEQIHELAEIKDRAKITQFRESLHEIARGGESDSVESMKEDLLKLEDFKEKGKRDDKKRTISVKRKTGDRERKQRDADSYIDKVGKEIRGDKLKKLSDEDLVERILDSKKHAKRALIYGKSSDEIEAAYDTAFKIALVYENELSNRIARVKLEKIDVESGLEDDMLSLLRAGSLVEFRDLWSSRSDSDVREVLSSMGGGPASDLESLMEGLKGHDMIESMGRFRGGMSGASEVAKNLADRGIQTERVFSILEEVRNDKSISSDMRMEEFIRRVKSENPGLGDEFTENLYGALVDLRGDEHYAMLQEALENENYELYVKRLMSYLFKVGLTEGQRDFELGILMRRAKTILANVEDESLVTLYDSFEKMVLFHDRYFTLKGGEAYSEMLNFLGPEPFKAFLDVYAHKLNVEVEYGEKESRLAVWKFYDMSQEEEWANKLIYTDPIHEEKVYEQMLLSQAMGQNVLKIEDNGQIIGTEGTAIGNLDDEIVVDGVNKKVRQFLADQQWLVGVGHDFARYSGRLANVLDNIDYTSARGMNKGILSVYKIKRYCEQYGIVPSFMFETLGLDTFLYSIENYKGLSKKGISSLFAQAKESYSKGIDVKTKELILSDDVGDAVKIIDGKLMNKRTLRSEEGHEEFNTNYVSLNDARLMSRRSFSLEDAREEYLHRQKLKGNNIDWSSLGPEDKALYSEQIELFHKKWSRMLLSKDEWTEIEKVDWASVNRQLEKRLGVKEGSIGDSFEGFIENFSYTRLWDYKSLRGTDIQDYGKYFTLAEKISGQYKSGFHGAATEAIVDALGNMLSYIPYDSSGYNRFATSLLTMLYDLRKRTFTYEKPATFANGHLKGKTLPNAELMVDESGYWVPEKIEKVSTPYKSPLEEERDLRSLGQGDIELAMRYAVAKGVVDKERAEKFLDKRYGGWLFRRVKKAIWFDDPWYLIDSTWEEGKKSLDSFLKYIFSG